LAINLFSPAQHVKLFKGLMEFSFCGIRFTTLVQWVGFSDSVLYCLVSGVYIQFNFFQANYQNLPLFDANKLSISEEVYSSSPPYTLSFGFAMIKNRLKSKVDKSISKHHADDEVDSSDFI
jgi:hypothetical protein